MITIVSAVVMVAVSYATAEPDYKRIRSLTFETSTDQDKRHTRSGWNWRDVTGSAAILLFILGAYLYFTG